MAYKLQVDGLAELSETLQKMGDDAQKVAASALYDGAGIMADEIKKTAETIQTAPFKYAREGQRLPSPEEKDIVVKAGTGIAKFDKDGDEVNTSVGYRKAGYADLNGKQKPVPLIVNSINSGTSFMKKQPFIRKAANSGGKRAMDAMKAKIESAFENMTKK